MVTSISTMSAPISIAARTAAMVFSGAAPENLRIVEVVDRRRAIGGAGDGCDQENSCRARDELFLHWTAIVRRISRPGTGTGAGSGAG
jgi:hypothetical protein